MAIDTKALTQLKSRAVSQFHPGDEWEVMVGKEIFVLNGRQWAVVDEAMSRGVRGMVRFGEFGFSIAHVSSYKRLRQGVDIDPLTEASLSRFNKDGGSDDR